MLNGMLQIPKIPMGNPKNPHPIALRTYQFKQLVKKTPKIGIIWFIRDILHNFAATQRECVPAPRAGGPYSK